VLKFPAAQPIIHVMPEKIASVLEELRCTTESLFPTANRLDLNQIEEAVASREKVVAQLSALIAQHPYEFTPEHLESVRQSHMKGKRALEKVLETRRTGWVTATELSKNEYILKSFARSGYSPERKVTPKS
jgi:hypothetical protein